MLLFIKAIMRVFATKLHYSKISHRVLVDTNVSEELGASIFRIAKDYSVGMPCLEKQQAPRNFGICIPISTASYPGSLVSRTA